MKNSLILDEKREEVGVQLALSRKSWIRQQTENIPYVSDIEKWKIVNDLTNSSPAFAVQPIAKMQEDGSTKYLFDDDEILDEMEKYHITKTGLSDINHEMEQLNRLIEEARKNVDAPGIMNNPISDEEVKITFNTCTGASGPDGFHSKLIDRADRASMEKCISYIYNRSWSEGNFLASWKQEQRAIIPKLDKDDFHHCNSYRTVSVTAILGKRMEKISSRRLIAILEELGFDVTQFAYLNERSATQAGLVLVERVQCALNNNLKCGGVFFDFTDAFGSVNRVKLLSKLFFDFGVDGRLFLHLANFLMDRKARLKIGKSIGSWMETNVGSSAGTVLGPVLFVTYTHDVPRFICPKFADDFNGLAIEKTYEAMIKTLQSIVDQVWSWAVRNGMELNHKTKVMCFGSEQITLEIYMNGKLLEQVHFYKFCGILVDEKLTFEQHTEFACGKAKSALNKISILSNGRRGLAVGGALELYKTMIRTHLEYGSAVWMYRNDKLMKEYQSVQQKCLKKLCGVFQNSSGAAVEVITGVFPIDLRLKRLCRREWARIKALNTDHPHRKMLEEADHKKNSITPLSYLKHSSRKIEQVMKSNFAVIKERQPLIPELIVEARQFTSIEIFEGEIGNSKKRSQAQGEKAKVQLAKFLEDKGSNVLVFSDGSAMGTSIGCGGCGVVLVPPNGAELRIKSKFVSNLTENVECEVEGVILAMSEALEYYKKTETKSDCCYVFTDCESAIDVFVNQKDVVKWSFALRRAWSFLKKLEELDISVKLAWVPGHAGIEFNEIADSAAKEGCNLGKNVEKIDEVSYSTISKWVDLLVKSEWQEKWLRSDTGLFTREIVPCVQNSIRIPIKRDVGIAYLRCLLNNASVADNMFRMKLLDDPNCTCEKSRQTVEHILLHCDNHVSERLLLKTRLNTIWNDSKKSGNLNFDLQLLLNPFSTKLNVSEAKKVAKEVETFLDQIDITL